MEWVFDGENLTPAAVMRSLATMRPTAPLGAQYQYSNPMAAAAGYVGGHAAYPGREFGAAYDAAMQAHVFDPLAMRATTFDFARAKRGPLAMPHSHASDGRTVALDPDINLNSFAMRPDGGAWSNVNDLLRYVQMELADGLLPDGRRYIAAAPLLARRAPQVARGAGQAYGMGLKLDRTTGALIVHVGGTMPGYVSDMMWLPEHGVGAVVLTNADNGGIHLRSLFRRRLLELLFDGKSEAEPTAVAQARRMRETLAAERQGLTLPADPALGLAARYRSAELGDIVVSRRGGATWFDFGGWSSEMGSQRGDDGTPSLVTVSGGVSGFRFRIADADGKRTLVLRDAQREYRFGEAR